MGTRPPQLHLESETQETEPQRQAPVSPTALLSILYSSSLFTSHSISKHFVFPLGLCMKARVWVFGTKIYTYVSLPLKTEINIRTLTHCHETLTLFLPFPLSHSSTTRHDFIIAKYKNLQLLPRLSQKDNPNAYQDLSKVRGCPCHNC